VFLTYTHGINDISFRFAITPTASAALCGACVYVTKYFIDLSTQRGSGSFFQIRVVGSACGLGYETFHCYFYITQIWEFVYQIRVVGSTCDYVDCSLRLLAVRGPAKFCSKALQISSTMNPKVMKN
jgi:hypothetical protein